VSRFGGVEPPVPKRPFRDSAIFYAVLSLIIVGVAAITGGDIAKASLVAIGFFVVATAWSWWRFRERIARESRK
jgi:membrane protein implicated in regulation of membrane protease activity